MRDIILLEQTLKSGYESLRDHYRVQFETEKNFYLYKEAPQGVRLMEMGIKKGSTYPLHDHPQMIVFSLLLKGKVQVTFKDCKLEQPLTSPRIGQSLDLVDKGSVIANEGDLVWLCHGNNNFHQLDFLTDSVIFDVIINDYDQDGRKMSIMQPMEPSSNIFSKLTRFVVADQL